MLLKFPQQFCDFQGQDYIVVSNKEKLAELEKVVLECLPEDKFFFEEKKETNGVNNAVACDATYAILIVKNEIADKKWIEKDSRIVSMSNMIAE